MVPDALERVPEMLDTPPSQNNYALLNEAGKSPAFFLCPNLDVVTRRSSAVWQRHL